MCTNLLAVLVVAAEVGIEVLVEGSCPSAAAGTLPVAAGCKVEVLQLDGR